MGTFVRRPPGNARQPGLVSDCRSNRNPLGEPERAAPLDREIRERLVRPRTDVVEVRRKLRTPEPLRADSRVPFDDRAELNDRRIKMRVGLIKGGTLRAALRRAARSSPAGSRRSAGPRRSSPRERARATRESSGSNSPPEWAAEAATMSASARNMGPPYRERS